MAASLWAACPPSPVVDSGDRRLGRLEDFQTFFFVCDMQDGFQQYNIQSYQEVVVLAQRLVRYTIHVHKFMIKYGIWCVHPPVC